MRNLVRSSCRKLQADAVSIEAVTANSEHADIVYAVGRDTSASTSVDNFVVLGTLGSRLAPIASFSSASIKAASGKNISIDAVSGNSIASFSYLEDGGESFSGPALCVITRGGDIVLVEVPRELNGHESNALASTPHDPEVVGSVPGGILAAAWSPDDEILVLVVVDDTATSGHPRGTVQSCKEKMIVMTRGFDVLSEGTVTSEDFGEDVPVDVGWGSKTTQFHGSEGKSAAAAAASIERLPSFSRGTHTPDDDGLPHISWRGDGNFFFVSSLEAAFDPGESKEEGGTWSRVIRTFSRTGSLSATSDPAVRGLTHTCAARPVGNLIASTQRFGHPDGQQDDASRSWALGRSGRHDVVFFERNGLRHGEFTLYEEEITITSEPHSQTVFSDASAASQDSSLVFRHRVRKLAWNADGSALLVWLTRWNEGQSNSQAAATDVAQIWTTSNYHWYLKVEIPAEAPSAHFSSIEWHHDKPWLLHLSTQTSVFAYTFHLDHTVSPSRWPHDACCTAVTDGPAVLLTPFRSQNIPPPMSALRLLPGRAGGSARAVPSHMAFADVPAPSQIRNKQGHLPDSCSILAIVYPSALMQVWMLEWGDLRHHADVKGLRNPSLLFSQLLAPDEKAGSPRFSPGQVAIVGKRRVDDIGGDTLHLCVAVLGFAQPVGGRSLEEEDQLLFLEISASMSCETKKSTSKSTFHGLGSPTDRKLIAGRALWSNSSAESDGTSSLESEFIICRESGSVDKVTYTNVKPVLACSTLHLPSFCSHLSVLYFQRDAAAVICGLNDKGVLAVSSTRQSFEKGSTVTLTRDATSFISTESFLIWTTSTHEAWFLAMDTIAAKVNDPACGGDQELPVDVEPLSRQVERGSRIVTCSPSNMSLILQMPRGNLEIIYPRALVLRLVLSALDDMRYGFALRRARTHRIDLNVLCDHSPKTFLASISRFLDVVQDPEHINLFLSTLRDEDVLCTLYKAHAQGRDTESVVSPEGKTNRITNAILVQLASRDQDKYINTILTAHVRKSPPDLEGGLAVLLNLKNRNAGQLEEAVKYIIFLADGDALFKAALGMYDFTLALLIAQHATKQDPREYLPFLRGLRAIQPVEKQRYAIDDHLARHAKALRWLAKVPGSADDAMTYIVRHSLFREALVAYKDDKMELLRVHNLYGDHLLAGDHADEAALEYTLAGNWRAALSAFRAAGLWQEAFAVALTSSMSKDDIESLARDVSDELETDRRLKEAAQVALEYGRDVERAVELFCRAGDITEAKRACASHRREDLMKTHIQPALLELHSGLMGEVSEMEEQLQKQLARLDELRTKKEENSAAFYLENDPTLDHVDVMTDTSTQMTQFTRYTVGAGSMLTSGSSRQSSSKRGSESVLGWERKRQQREERKKSKGKKGSVYEESYLYDSLQKLVRDRLGRVQEDTRRLLPHLIVGATTPKDRGRAQQLQHALGQLEIRALEGVNGLWQAVQVVEAARMVSLLEEVEREQRILTTLDLQAFSSARERAARPRLEVSSTRWKSAILAGGSEGATKT